MPSRRQKKPSLVYLMDLADVLTRYAVAARYPGLEEEVGEAEYLRAIELARRVVQWAEKVIKKGET